MSEYARIPFLMRMPDSAPWHGQRLLSEAYILFLNDRNEGA